MKHREAFIVAALRTVETLAPLQAAELAAVVSAESELVVGRGGENMKVGIRLLPTRDGKVVAIEDDEVVTMPMTRSQLNAWLAGAIDRALVRREEQEAGLTKGAVA
jgi:Tfp pilus assembly protein PilP